MAVGKNITGKRKSGSNIIFSGILWLLGRILSGEYRESRSRWKNIWDGKDYQVAENLIHSCNKVIEEAGEKLHIAEDCYG